MAEHIFALGFAFACGTTAAFFFEAGTAAGNTFARAFAILVGFRSFRLRRLTVVFGTTWNT